MSNRTSLSLVFLLIQDKIEKRKYLFRNRERVLLEIKIFKRVLTFVQLLQGSLSQDRSEKEDEPKQADHSSNS